MSHYTLRVGARAELAKALKEQEERVKSAGIKLSDLDVIATEGDKAREADRIQRVQLAEGEANVKDRAEREANVLARGDHLRDLLPATVYSLRAANETTEAKFLAALSFARFRLRDLKPTDASDLETAEVKAVQRVEREDKPAQLTALANFATTLLDRPVTLSELAERGVDRAWLETLRDDANAAARAGRNVRKAADATKDEAEAVAKQQEAWSAVRRLIRKAVRGSADLEKMFAEC